ncbi:MAG: hypothetical protein KC421_13475 [Anaerolineales bacterium]|nr:hypothetical protein [Anaerolineales bacterium]
MALAEIYGKTPFIYFEDLLTADVFAAFRYLPSDIGIIGFLRSIPGLESLIEKPDEHSTCTFHFWPVGSAIGREPDVLLELEINGRILHIIIEAKYYSGPSDKDDEEIEINGDPQRVGNQLGDQLHDLEYGVYRIFQGSSRNTQLILNSRQANRFLIYLTAHAVKPTYELSRVSSYYQQAESKLFWSSWYHVHDYFRSLRPQLAQFPYSYILADVCALLDRKEFVTFQGFHLSQLTGVKPEMGSFWQDRRIDDLVFNGISKPPVIDWLNTAVSFFNSHPPQEKK